MNHQIAEILRETADPDRFRDSLQRLDGEFDFSPDTMMSLGEVYCSLYPESVSHGDSAQVQAGYRIVRIAIIEFILKGMEPALKKMYREMFTSVPSINGHLSEICRLKGAEEALRIHNQLDFKIRELKSEIDSIENSVIKERFTGGITLFYNVLYLMKRGLGTAQTESK